MQSESNRIIQYVLKMQFKGNIFRNFSLEESWLKQQWDKCLRVLQGWKKMYVRHSLYIKLPYVQPGYLSSQLRPLWGTIAHRDAAPLYIPFSYLEIFTLNYKVRGAELEDFFFSSVLEVQ